MDNSVRSSQLLRDLRPVSSYNLLIPREQYRRESISSFAHRLPRSVEFHPICELLPPWSFPYHPTLQLSFLLHACPMASRIRLFPWSSIAFCSLKGLLIMLLGQNEKLFFFRPGITYFYTCLNIIVKSEACKATWLKLLTSVVQLVSISWRTGRSSVLLNPSVRNTVKVWLAGATVYTLNVPAKLVY